MKLTHRTLRGKAVKYFVHLYAPSTRGRSDYVSLCLITSDWWRHFGNFFVVFHVLPSYVLISWGSWTINECDSITLTYHECCTMSTTGLFPDAHSDHAWLYPFFFFFSVMFMTDCLSQQVVKEWRGFVCVCVCVFSLLIVFFFLAPEAGLSAEAYTSSVKLLNEESLMEPFVVCVDQLLGLSASLTKISLCFWEMWCWSQWGLSRGFTPPLQADSRSVPAEGFSQSFHYSSIEWIQL